MSSDGAQNNSQEAKPTREEAHAAHVQTLFGLLEIVIIFAHHESDEHMLVTILQSSFDNGANHESILQRLESAMGHLMQNGGPHNGGSTVKGEVFQNELAINDLLDLSLENIIQSPVFTLWTLLVLAVISQLRLLRLGLTSQGLVVPTDGGNMLENFLCNLNSRRETDTHLIRPDAQAGRGILEDAMAESESSGTDSSGTDSLSRLPVVPDNSHLIMRPRTVHSRQPVGETAHDPPMNEIHVQEQEHIEKSLQVQQAYTGFMPPNFPPVTSGLTGDDVTTDTTVAGHDKRQTIRQQYEEVAQDHQQEPNSPAMQELLRPGISLASSSSVNDEAGSSNGSPSMQERLCPGNVVSELIVSQASSLSGNETGSSNCSNMKPAAKPTSTANQTNGIETDVTGHEEDAFASVTDIPEMTVSVPSIENLPVPEIAEWDEAVLGENQDDTENTTGHDNDDDLHGNDPSPSTGGEGDCKKKDGTVTQAVENKKCGRCVVM